MALLCDIALNDGELHTWIHADWTVNPSDDQRHSSKQPREQNTTSPVSVGDEQVDSTDCCQSLLAVADHGIDGR